MKDITVKNRFQLSFTAACLTTAISFFALALLSLPANTATLIDRSGAHPSWSKEQLTDFMNTIDGTVIGAAKILKPDGWLGDWTAGNIQYNAKKAEFLYLRTKAQVKHSTHTRGKSTDMAIAFRRLKDGQDSTSYIPTLEARYQGFVDLSDKYRSNTISKAENLNAGDYSKLIIGKSKNKSTGRALTFTGGYILDGNWIIEIYKARNPDAVKTVLLALHQAFSGSGTDSRPVQPVRPPSVSENPTGNRDRTQLANSDGLGDATEDRTSVDDRMADPTGGELEDFEQFFYRIEIPEGKKLVVFEDPSLNAEEIIRLLPGANDLQVNKLEQTEGRVWASLCASSQCGWVIADYLRRDKKRSEAGFGFAEVAYPEVNLFTDPTVQSPLIGVLKQGEKYKPDLVVTDDDGADWIRICGGNWCGWAGREFFSIN